MPIWRPVRTPAACTDSGVGRNDRRDLDMEIETGVMMERPAWARSRSICSRPAEGKVVLVSAAVPGHQLCAKGSSRGDLCPRPTCATCTKPALISPSQPTLATIAATMMQVSRTTEIRQRIRPSRWLTLPTHSWLHSSFSPARQRRNHLLWCAQE
jgi:hypothetical protein